MPGRNRDCYWVQPKHRLRSVYRNHTHSTRGHGQSNHVMVNRHCGMIRGRTEVTSIIRGNRSNSINPGAFNCHFHRHWTNHQSMSTVAIQSSCSGHLTNNFRARRRINPAFSKRFDIVTQHIRNAVCLDASNIRINKNI